MGHFPKSLSASLKNMYLQFTFKNTFKGFSSNTYYLHIIVCCFFLKKRFYLDEKGIYIEKKNMHLVKFYVFIHSPA